MVGGNGSVLKFDLDQEVEVEFVYYYCENGEESSGRDQKIGRIGKISEIM